MDIQFSRHGSLFLARPVSDLGQWWLEAHMTAEALWRGGAVVIAPCYVEPKVASATGQAAAQCKTSEKCKPKKEDQHD